MENSTASTPTAPKTQEETRIWLKISPRESNSLSREGEEKSGNVCQEPPCSSTVGGTMTNEVNTEAAEKILAAGGKGAARFRGI